LYNLSIASDGRDHPGAFLGKVGVADQGGCYRIWIANHLFERDPIGLAAAALGASSTLRVALMAMSPFTIHPVQLTMAAATLNELFPGRLTLCFGSGAPVDLKSIGIENVRPISALRDSVRLSRALLAGEQLHFAGETFQIKGRRLFCASTTVPLIVAASGPKMLEMAGAEADGVLISAGSSIEFIRWSIGQIDRGANGRKVRLIALIYVSVDDDRKRAHDRLRRLLANTLRGPHHAKNLELAGSSLNQEVLRNSLAADDWEAASKLISDSIVENHAASGTIADVTARLHSYHEAGVDEIVVSGVSQPNQLSHIIKAANKPTRGVP
jgi:5,10-methylenetetrahydromethanopterin reductase